VHRLRALVLVTFRTEEAVGSHGLRVLFGDVASATGVRRIDLNPLSTDGVRSLLEDAAGDGQASSAVLGELHRGTRGDPFFVPEVIAAGGESLPRSVREAVLSRAARLSPLARGALDLVALAGPRVEVDLVEDVAPDLAPALDEVLAHGVVLLSGDVLTFRHE